MKGKLLNFGVLLVSMVGYLQWGDNHSMFLFEVELELFAKLIKDPISVLHPFTVLPMLGQLLLFITLMQRKPSKILTYTGIACIAILLVLMFFIGVISFKLKIILSTLPFLVIAFFAIREQWRKRGDHPA